MNLRFSNIEISDEEMEFINTYYGQLSQKILDDSDSDPKATEELENIPLVGTVVNLIDAIKECEEKWLAEEYDMKKIYRVTCFYDDIPMDELEYDDELSDIYYVHSYTMELADRLLTDYIVPSIAINQLHKEWIKRHGGAL